MRFKLFILLFLGLFFNFISSANAFSNGEKQTVRVAISNQNFSTYEHQNAKISSDEDITIIDISQENTSSKINTVPKNSIVEVMMNVDRLDIYINNELKHSGLIGPILFSSKDDLKIIDLNRKGLPAKYKGMIEIKIAKNNQSFNLINIIDMQNYIRGVIPNEMPVSFGLEALKAQAIAARNYAMNAKMSANYDLVDSTAAQVYYGSNSYREITDIAVEQTKGIYALYKDKPISALYFSTSIGITDDWDDVFSDGFNKGLHPYLKSVTDNEKQKPIKDDEDLEKFLSKEDSGFDIKSPKFRWQFEFERQELEEILHNTLLAQSKAGLVAPKYEGDIKLENLKEIKVLNRTQSGKITELEIVAKNGQYKVKKELAIRRLFKKGNSSLPSANFYVKTKGADIVKSENEEEKTPEKKTFSLVKLFDYIDDNRYPEKFIFIGGGFGHGVGMSQYGASAMAKMGKKYPEILNHYYSDINFSTVLKTVLFNDYNVWYKTEFYFDKGTFENAYLYIDNSKNVSEFPFKINDLEFFDTKNIAKNKVVKINITQYLNQGINTINFAPLSDENKGKYVVYKIGFDEYDNKK